MSITSVRNLVDAETDGKKFFSFWRKAPVQTTTAGTWFDISMSPGQPVPNYYAASPNTAKALSHSDDVGIPHGGNVSPATKYLKSLTAMTVLSTAVPLTLILCDYLMYYPFVDMADVSENGITQTTNIATPRYSTGDGVQIMAVEVAAQAGAGNPQFMVQYTNSLGVTGRLTRMIACNTLTATGTLINTASATAATTGPFLPLQSGDTGVQKIEKVFFFTGDIGLITFVLVKPLATHFIRAITTPCERNYLQDFSVMPVIKDDAYLNFICLPTGTLATANILGSIETVWG
jgi:hypothetical protein